MSTRHMGKADGPLSHTEDDPAVEAGMSRDLINIPDNVLQQAVRGYAQADQDDVQWLFSYATAELGCSRTRLCEAVGYDWTTIWRIATGTYGAGIEEFMGAVRDLKRRVADAAGATDFIETFVARRIWDTLDYALAGDLKGGKIVLIVGPSGRGKTESVTEWARRNNHGRSVYVDTPESGGMRALYYEICGATRVNKGRKTSDLRDRIIGSFNRRRILIVDEVARLMPTGREVRVQEMEFLRRLHDKTRCAIALIATPAFEHMLETSRLQAYLEQLIGRIAEPLKIPETVYRDECRAILKAFGGDGSRELLDLSHTIANQRGRLRILFELLAQAAAVARRRSTPLTHAHLSAAWKRRQDRFAWPEKDQ